MKEYINQLEELEDQLREEKKNHPNEEYLDLAINAINEAYNYLEAIAQ